MQAWNGLFKKEFRLARMGVVIGLLALGICMILIALVAERVEEPMVMVSLGVGMIMAHVFYLVVHMLTSLNNESKYLHQWLHNPRSGVALLSAKLCTGILAMIVSLGAACLYALYALNQFGINELYATVGWTWAEIVPWGITIIVMIFAASIYMTMWVVLAWTVYQVFYRQVGRWSWIAAIAILLIPTWALDRFQETPAYGWITQWGQLNLEHFQYILSIDDVEVQLAAEAMPHVYLGEFVFYLAIIVGLFFLSGWLLDRKVEV